MVEQKICSFCGGNIEPGTGRIFVRKDGLTYNFCGSKCFKNLVIMKRLPREIEWTAAYKREKEVRMAPLTEGSKRTAGKAAAAKKVRKVARTVKSTEKSPTDKKSEAPAEAEGEKK
jgi:large subunit ribosomal protein L24e